MPRTCVQPSDVESSPGYSHPFWHHQKGIRLERQVMCECWRLSYLLQLLLLREKENFWSTSALTTCEDGFAGYSVSYKGHSVQGHDKQVWDAAELGRLTPTAGEARQMMVSRSD